MPENRHQIEASPVGRRALNKETEHRGFATLDWLEERNDAGVVTFVGYASMFNREYDVAGLFTEVVRRGAFARTLSHERKIHFLANHGGVPLASTQGGTLRLLEDDRGLAVAADLDMASPWAQTVASAVRRGDMDEMSFGFQVVRDEWDDEFTYRNLLEVKLFEVSTVPRGANPYTEGVVQENSSDIATVEVSEPEADPGGLARALSVRTRMVQYQ